MKEFLFKLAVGYSFNFSYDKELGTIVIRQDMDKDKLSVLLNLCEKHKYPVEMQAGAIVITASPSSMEIAELLK